MTPPYPVHLSRYEDGRLKDFYDELAPEEPLEIRVEGQSIAVVMRTPGHDRELAAGFLLSEGIIKGPRDLFDITTCVAAGTMGKGNAVDVALAQPASFDVSKFSRHVMTSASCGICSKTSIETALRRHKPIPPGLQIDPAVVLTLPRKLARRQETFQRTGGLHACALFTPEGRLLELREDIGRHNALDKLLGWALLEKMLPLSNCLLLLSGRTSFEMMQKAYSAGVPIVAAISAPSSLAVEFARDSGQTLAGFVRGRTMNVYSGPERFSA